MACIYLPKKPASSSPSLIPWCPVVPLGGPNSDDVSMRLIVEDGARRARLGLVGIAAGETSFRPGRGQGPPLKQPCLYGLSWSYTRWCPSLFAKLVQITPITMIYR